MKSNKKKLSLEELKIDSFLTSNEMHGNIVKGGDDSSGPCVAVNVSLSIIRSVIFTQSVVSEIAGCIPDGTCNCVCEV